jgi:hypothetical protein
VLAIKIQVRDALATDSGPEELLASLEADRERIRQLVGSVVMPAKDLQGFNGTQAPPAKICP